MKMAKETWIQGQCQEVEACLKKNNSKKAYQLVNDLTTEKQGKSTMIQDKSGKCLTEENEIIKGKGNPEGKCHFDERYSLSKHFGTIFIKIG